MDSLLVCVWFSALLLITITVIKMPHSIIRPSIFLATLFLLRISSSAVFTTHYKSKELDLYLENSDWFRLLAVLFPLALNLLTIATPNITHRYRALFNSLKSPIQQFSKEEKSFIMMVFVVALFILINFIFEVGIQDFGMTAIFTDPFNSAEAREASTTNLSIISAYGYSIFRHALVPIIVISLLLDQRMRKNVVKGLLLFIFAVVSVSLPGERGGPTNFIFVMFIAYWLRNSFITASKLLLPTFSVIVIIGILLTIMREGRSDLIFSLNEIQDKLSGIITRIFETPFVTGVWSNIYAQNHGLLGLSGVRPLTWIFGQEHVRLPQIVFWEFASRGPIAGGANTSFLFDFQAMFGFAGGWLISVFCSFLLDLFGLTFSKIDGRILVATYAAFLGSFMSLTSSAFFTCLLTHGIASPIILALIFKRFYQTGRDMDLKTKRLAES